MCMNAKSILKCKIDMSGGDDEKHVNKLLEKQEKNISSFVSVVTAINHFDF